MRRLAAVLESVERRLRRRAVVAVACSACLTFNLLPKKVTRKIRVIITVLCAAFACACVRVCLHDQCDLLCD